MLRIQFKLPRPTTSTSKDVHGRLFLCLKSRKIKGFGATGFKRGHLSSAPFGIPSVLVPMFGTPQRCQK